MTRSDIPSPSQSNANAWDPWAGFDRLAVRVLERLAAGEPVAVPAEPGDRAGPRAGDDVGLPVAVEVHQLWTEADVSPGRR